MPSPEPAFPHGGQLGRDQFEVPIHRQADLWVELLEAAAREGRQVAPQQEVILGLGQPLH